jgi:hypothetical protein
VKLLSGNVWQDSYNTGVTGNVEQNGLYFDGSAIYWATYSMIGNDNIYSYSSGTWDTSFYVDYNCSHYAVAADSSSVYAACVLLTGAEYALWVFENDGATITDITSPLNVTGLSQTFDSPALEIFNGDLFLACYDPASNSPVVRRYTGSGWVDADNNLNVAGHPEYISMAKDDTHLYMSFYMGGFPYVYVYNGSSWYDLESSVIAPGGGGRPAIDVYDGKIYIAYTDSLASNKVTVKKYTGAWTVVGTAGFTDYAASSYGVSISIDQYGIPFVGYSNTGDGNKATVMKYE